MFDAPLSCLCKEEIRIPDVYVSDHTNISRFYTLPISIPQGTGSSRTSSNHTVPPALPYIKETSIRVYAFSVVKFI